MYLADAAKAVKGTLHGDNLRFSSVSTDTRTIQPGDLFVALKGPNFNGHDYVQQAADSGAIALMVSEEVKTDLPQIRVENTLAGLGALGAAWKAQFTIKTIAITGSSGKTSVKEMAAAILSLKGETLATRGNFNNEIGVPLTLLSLTDKHQYAVIELGANHIGEIAYTVSLVKPNVAAITNAGSAHIEGFGSRENIAKAKGEIYQGLVANGTAVINMDDAYCEYWQSITEGYAKMSFSLENKGADVYASDINVNTAGQYGFRLHVGDDSILVQLKLLGAHNVLNAINAAAMTAPLDVDLETVRRGLESVEPIRGRLYPIPLDGGILIDDTYNANPASVKAAADLLAELDVTTCMVLGDMAELGTHAPSMHREVGEYIALKGIEYLVAKGKHAADYLVGFSKFQSIEQKSARFDEFHEVASYLQQEKPETVLVKGSRSAAMENVVHALCGTDANDKRNH
ncbi:MAG: UDP-N-acetylmuramoyl-tripeptide--D-alanyl-D-alanine ligase [Ketobacteraceae bacterium]|nr:UDP-N-acetylmuramoyl-tripeptide--D-alanyl-D-alanine ligase [Ketobacteraceae bacterium]